MKSLWLFPKPRSFCRETNRVREIRQCLKKEYELPHHGIDVCYDDRILFISPKQDEFKHHLLNNKHINLETTILHGISDVVHDKKVIDFMHKIVS